MGRNARIALVVAALVAAGVLFAVLSGGSDDSGSGTTTGSESEAEPTTTGPEQRQFTVIVRDAKPVGGVQKLAVKQGDRVSILVRSDTADELHLHGYDISKDVSAGGKARLDFQADIEGVFELELESRAERIAELEVSPS